MSAPDTKIPNLAAFLFVILGLLIALIGGIRSGSIAGGIIAGLGIIPACWGMWTGIQQKTQGGMAVSVLLFLAALAVGGILILLRFVDWLV